MSAKPAKIPKTKEAAPTKEKKEKAPKEKKAKEPKEKKPKEPKEPKEKKPPKIRPDGTTYRWTDDEHSKFLEGIALHGFDLTKIAQHVETRNVTQVKSHAQKYYDKPENAAAKDALVKLRKKLRKSPLPRRQRLLPKKSPKTIALRKRPLRRLRRKKRRRRRRLRSHQSHQSHRRPRRPRRPRSHPRSPSRLRRKNRRSRSHRSHPRRKNQKLQRSLSRRSPKIW